jgi:ATP-binding cassette subfamily C (CFTR/MRP) protein 4
MVQNYLLWKSYLTKETNVKKPDKAKRTEQAYVNVRCLNAAWDSIVVENIPFETEPIKLSNAVLNDYVLENITFELKQNELLGVVGPVGSGKSSLLMALLGEIPNIKDGAIDMNGSVFYVSQEPWVFSATIKENILFGKEYNKAKFDKIVDVCSLIEDLKILPAGHDTFIGEKGANLSGGQRARISLARALYSDADIYLLDDPLSAVDANVARHLYNE